MKNKKFSLLTFFLLLSVFNVYGAENSPDRIIKVETQRLPYIKNPDFRDNIFKAYLEDADSNARLLKSDKEGYLSFYRVHVPENMDFIWLSSRLSPVFKDTVSTLNRLSSADTVIAGKDLTVCTVSGLFIPEKPLSAWEQLLYKEFVTKGSLEKAKTISVDGEIFYFFEKERFDSTTALFFLDTKMICPLKSRVLTSNYGYRISPISGKWKFHSGIDLAAPEGTEVYACRSGSVSQTGFNSTYGNYVIILHYNSMTSVYAHLSKILVEKGAKINGGTVIGRVGTTGASTGPHLHFELRKNGNPEDPGKSISF